MTSHLGSSVVDVQDTDRGLNNALPKALPVEHAATRYPRISTAPSKTRPSSMIDTLPSRRLKSASVVLHSTQPFDQSRHRHTASTITTQPPVELQESDEAADRASDYFIALASQERRVLELKDELRRAEEDLNNLKKQWSSHEAAKRRSEARKLHQMRPMSTSVARHTRGDDSDGSSAWMYEEMERRKALMGHNRPASTSRRVFSGSRHAKPLSLVPAMKEESQESSEPHTNAADDDGNPSAARVERSMTAPNLDSTSNPTYGIMSIPSPQREVFETGKQLATEWRDGLWTFFEDLKQATVGEEQALEQHNVEAAKTWTSLIRPPQKVKADDDAPSLIDTDSFWQEHGVEAISRPSQAPARRASPLRTPQKIPLHLREFDGESWETWDSPDVMQESPALSSGATTSQSATSGSPPTSSPSTSGAATQRSSLGVPTNGKRESIAWPALTRFNPGQLRRTASHLMDEWERSLLAPVEAPQASPSFDEDQHIEHTLMSHMR